MCTYPVQEKHFPCGHNRPPKTSPQWCKRKWDMVNDPQRFVHPQDGQTYTRYEVKMCPDTTKLKWVHGKKCRQCEVDAIVKADEEKRKKAKAEKERRAEKEREAEMRWKAEMDRQHWERVRGEFAQMERERREAQRRDDARRDAEQRGRAEGDAQRREWERREREQREAQRKAHGHRRDHPRPREQLGREQAEARRVSEQWWSIKKVEMYEEWREEDERQHR